MTRHLLSSARHETEPWGLGLFVRAVGRGMRAPFTGFVHWLRLLRIRHGGVDRARWWRSRNWFTVVQVLTYLLALVFVAWLVRAVIVLSWRGNPEGGVSVFGFSTNTVCSNKSTECGAVTGWVTSLLSVALATSVFVLWRLTRVRRRYLRAARRDPRRLVPTAGSIFGRIVGRDQLCRAIMEDLRDRRGRRAHVIVGGVGTGKTAVLVQLTDLLARRRAVPIPLRLREADNLDFAELARKRFLSEMAGSLSSNAEGDRIWRRMLADGRIVVLADGLEEVLTYNHRKEKDKDEEEARKARERDTDIRNAIHAAHKRELPVLIASRPHDPLRGMDATIHELEPLSQDDALSYVREGAPSEDDWRLSWIVAKADVAESPLYLQITKELSQHDMLRQVAGHVQVGAESSVDRSALRLRLMRAWEEALLRGDLHPEAPLSRPVREITLNQISVLACLGLRDDSIEVRLDEKVPPAIKREAKNRCDKTANEARRNDRAGVATQQKGLENIPMRLAATWGAQLGLVEGGEGRVRFQHSLIQAYLGSRLLSAAIANGDDKYLRTALGAPQGSRGGGEKSPRPGREFLTALVLCSRDTGNAHNAGGAARFDHLGVCRRLLGEAKTVPHRTGNSDRHDDKALDMYAAALEIVSAPREAYRRSAPVRARAGERKADSPTQQPDPGKVVLSAGPQTSDAVSTPGEMLREIADQVKGEWGKLQAADPGALEEAKIGLVRRFGEALRAVGSTRRPSAGESGYEQFYRILCQEDSFRVRLAGALEIGRSGSMAYEKLKRQLKPAGNTHNNPWAWQVSAWVVPVLMTSVDPRCEDSRQETRRGNLRKLLEEWVDYTCPETGRPQGESSRNGSRRLRAEQEIALAQGFKYAANRRHGQVHTRPEAWRVLEEQALAMLKRATHWFAELTLIQALTLLALSQGTEPPHEQEDGNAASPPERPPKQPDEIVERWLEVIDDKKRGRARGRRRRKRHHLHPFVEAAADLATRALSVQEPGRFLWMDESDAVSRIGAGQIPAGQHAELQRTEWIPASAGWSALDRPAQQLLADVVVLLNLAERGDLPEPAEKHLEETDKTDLPPCLTRDRRALEPLLTAGTAESHRPGSKCLDGCRFQLCPYPPKGLQHPRAELSEEFCRRQARLVHSLRIGRYTARWQGMRAGHMRTYWNEMAERARSNHSAP